MKQSRDVEALTASLRAAAAQPLQPLALPESPVGQVREQRQKQLRQKAATSQITLRPEDTLLQRYAQEAAKRTRDAGKGISVQHVMLEVLERNAP